MFRLAWAGAIVLALTAPAHAGAEDWRINEVVASVDGDPNIRFVELYVPPTPLDDNCFYATTVLEFFADDGTFLGSVAPSPAMVRCFPGDTYFMFATAEAVAHF